MPPKRTTPSTHASSASQTQADVQTNPPEMNDDDIPDDDADVAQLREQIHTLTQARKDDQETLKLILEQIATLAAAQTAQASQQNPVRSIERDTSSATESLDRSPKYSKKQPDPNPLSNGIDPTFESWKLQVQGKFRVNADHFQDEEAKMLYLFNRTSGDAQKHLRPRYDDESPVRFTSAQDMIQHLAAIYVNPNKVRDARYDYNRLMMKPTQTFVEFQTQFLHLAGEAQIPAESLRLDLYDKLTTQLQEKLAVHLRTLDTFAELSACCLSLDSELKRIAARVDRQKRIRDNKPSATPASLGVGPIIPSTATHARATPEVPRNYRAMLENPRNSELRQSTPVALPAPPTITCYNCHKPGHIAISCPEPKRADLKEIEEDLSEKDLSETEKSGKEEP